MEKPRRTWMPASWKFLPKPQRLPVNRKRLNVLVKAKIWHKANDKLVGRCEGRWMDVEEMSPIWCELHGVKKSQASFFFLKSEAFSLLMEAGAHLSLKDPLTVENRGTHCLWEHHLQTHFTHFVSVVSKPKMIPIWRADGVDFLDGTSRTQYTGDLLFFFSRTLVKAKDVSGKPRTERTRQKSAATSPSLTKNTTMKFRIC